MLWLSVLLLSSVGSCFSANILAVVLLASPSHYKWHKHYLLELAKRGHNITVLNYDKETKKEVNYEVITLEGVYEKLHEKIPLEELMYHNHVEQIKTFSVWDGLTCKFCLEAPAFKSFLRDYSNFNFDLIVWDIVNPNCLYPLAKRLGSPPIISTSAFGVPSYITSNFGNNIHTYIPFYQSVLTDKMGFLDRLTNAFYLYFMYLYRTHWISPHEEEIGKRYFGNDVGSLSSFQRNISLLLANSDPVLQYAEPLPPNVIPVGGLHILPNKKLPQDLQEIFDKAKDVIYVSLGTNLDFTKIEEYQRESILNDFKKLPYTFLLKCPEGDFKVPKNVIIRKWFPQGAILAHPKTKLFITHGGLLSTLETLHYGVPIVGIPFLMDQYGNVHNLVEKKLGVKIDCLKITQNVLYNAVSEVLNNPIYKKNMDIVSQRFSKQLTTPLQRAIYWTEYLLKFGSAEHLSPATRDMSLFKKLDLDILLVIVLIFISIITILCVLFGKICKVICSSKNTKLKRN